MWLNVGAAGRFKQLQVEHANADCLRALSEEGCGCFEAVVDVEGFATTTSSMLAVMLRGQVLFQMLLISA